MKIIKYPLPPHACTNEFCIECNKYKTCLRFDFSEENDVLQKIHENLAKAFLNMEKHYE